MKEARGLDRFQIVLKRGDQSARFGSCFLRNQTKHCFSVIFKKRNKLTGCCACCNVSIKSKQASRKIQNRHVLIIEKSHSARPTENKSARRRPDQIGLCDVPIQIHNAKHYKMCRTYCSNTQLRRQAKRKGLRDHIF